MIYPTSKCKGCGRTIVWGTNPATGKKVPLDPSAHIYRALLTPNGVEAIKEDDDDLMVSHFQTCAEANAFNRSKA